MNRRSFLKVFGIGLVASVATRATQARVCERQSGFLDRMYPVGSIYISISATNPGTTLGGTWVRFGEGAVLAGVSTTDSDFDFRANFAVRGAKTHTLTTAQMPSHTHIQDPHTHSTTFAAATGVGNGVFVGHLSHHGNIASATAVNQNTGGGAAHNNLQPYITVFMWRRSA